MSDQYIEKSFIYIVVFSLLLHALVFAVIIFMPAKKHVVEQKPYMVDLEDLPQTQQIPISKDIKVKRKSYKRLRVNKETAPRGEMPRDQVASIPYHIPRSAKQVPAHSQKNNIYKDILGEKGNQSIRKAVPGGDLFVKRKQTLPELARLYPNASGLARLEESYRRKYEAEVKEGETKFLNTDDIQFGSFLRRFEIAVYGVWRYPSDAARLGIEGVTPVKITFNRKGEIENVQLLESSGSKILDDEVFRALRLIGPLGSFPKGYDRDKFSLIAFFQYGIISGASRGMIH
jgi:protein TonB